MRNEGAMNMTLHHAGLVIIDPKRGENLLLLIVFLIIAAIKDIFSFLLHKTKDFFKWVFRWGRKQ